MSAARLVPLCFKRAAVRDDRQIARLGFSSALRHYDAGGGLIEHFLNSESPELNSFCGTHVRGDADVTYCPWAVDKIRALV